MHLALFAIALTAPPELVLDANTRRLEVDRRLEMLVDATQKLSLADVRSALQRGRFTPTKGVPNLGFTSSAAWFRVRLRSALRRRQHFYLEINHLILDRVAIHVRSRRRGAAAGPFVRHLFGDLVPGEPRLAVPSYALALHFEPGETKTIYIRAITGGALQLPVTLYHPDRFIDAVAGRLLFYAPMLGVLFVLLLYDILLFAMVRDRSYFDYALCVLPALCYVGYLSGIAQTYVLPPIPWITNTGYPLAIASGMVAVCHFTRRFLSLRTTQPWADVVMRVLMLGGVMVLPLALVAGYHAALMLTVAVCVLGCIAAVVVGALALRRGYRPARFYVLAWSAFCLGVLIYSAQKSGYAPVSMFTENAAIVGFVTTMVLLPLGLADRISLLRQEKSAAQQRVIELQTEQAGELEAEVARKTIDLRAANEELEAGNTRLKQEIEQRAETERERQTLERRLFENQKLDAIGQLAGGVAHDMNNILAAISNTAASVAATLDDGDARYEEIDDLLAATRRGGELAKNLLGFARRGTYTKAPLDLHELINETHRLLRRTIHQGVEIELELEAARPWVEGDASQLAQVLVNLAINAAQAMKDRGALVIRTYTLTPEGDDDAARICLEVEDTGPGMTEATQRRAFEPFFTTKAPGEGTGLGLSMVYGAVQVHDGEVGIDSEEGRGTTVRVVLPALDVPPPKTTRSTKSTRRHAVAAERAGAILLVDDEHLLRKSAARLLRRMGYRLLQAEDGAEALEVFRAHKDEIALVLLDLVMPVMDGFEAFRQLREVDHELPIVLTSGYSPEGAVEQLLGEDGVYFVQKPYLPDRLQDVLERAYAAASGG
jgi:signal transduction histidine kinase/ActR/RegA family two-component response regulator